MHKNLRTFIEQLGREKEIVKVTAEVDPNLELAEIHRRVVEEGGPALLFTRVRGSSFPVATNLFGTVRRMELAMGPRPEAIIQRAIQAMDKLMPPGFKALWQERGWLLDVARSGLRRVSPQNAPVLEVCMANVDLRELPVLTSWQEDGGLFHPAPGIYRKAGEP
jgi:3-octaprenyl-4hydroxybenzoate decarboxylase (EC 4.1.1.-)